MTKALTAIKAGLTAECCEDAVRDASPASSPVARRRLLYPYYWVELRHEASTWLGTSAMRIACLVDARTRVSSTTEPFEIESIEANDDEVIAPGLEAAEALGLAERYAGYVLKHRRKALVAPKTELLGERLIHKPFWVVDCAAFALLVDGVTGRFHPLSRRHR